MTSSSSSVADNAHELITDLHNNPDIIPPYRTELISKCAQQITSLYDDNMKSLTDLKDNKCTNRASTVTMVHVRQNIIDRIKRCCCAYIAERQKRLRRLRWEKAGMLPDEVKKNLAPEELNWFNSYNDMIFKFQKGFGKNGLSLMNYMDPPNDLRMNVVAMKDYGEFETSDGDTVLLSKGSAVSLPIQDCEMMIRRGILKEVNSSDTH